MIEAVYNAYKTLTCPRHMAGKDTADPRVWERIRKDIAQEIQDALGEGTITPEQVEALEEEFSEIFLPIVVEVRGDAGKVMAI